MVRLIWSSTYLFSFLQGAAFLLISIRCRYLKAVENKEKSKDLEKAKKDKRGPIKPAPRQPMKSEKQYWEAFALFLQKYEKLPVVAFTLSRNKCDRNAEFLVSIDFTTSDEKSYINYCFNQSIKTLKPEDQNLPQVVTEF